MKFNNGNAARAAARETTAHISRFILAVMLFAGCDSTLEPAREVPAPEVPARVVRIEAVTPTTISGAVMSPVTPVPTVRAIDQDGRPVQGVAVLFVVGDGGGTVASDSVSTDSLGLATVGTWTLGRTAGLQGLEVFSNGRSSVLFRAVANAGPVAQMYWESGNGQVAAARETLTQPLRVKVVDAFNNLVALTTVTFTVLTGEGRIEGSTVRTNSFGIAESGRWTLGSLPGVQKVGAQAGGREVVFSAFACESCNRFLLFERNGVIYRAIGNSGQEIRLTEGVQPAWSPDGQRIAFSRVSGSRIDIYLMDADGSNIVRRTFSNGATSSTGFQSPAWSPDGSKLAVSGSDWYSDAIYILNVDDDKEPVRIRDNAAMPAWSPDGSKIAFVRLSNLDSDAALMVMNTDGSDVWVVVPDNADGALDHPAWSPDGRRIVFTRWDVKNGGADVYSVGSDGSALTRLTAGWITTSPAWSPDGAWIAFTMWTGEWPWTNTSIAFVPADSGGQPFTLISSGNNPVWQPGPQRNWR